MGHAIPLGSAVYVRYLDHVLFRNTPEAPKTAAERETIGWLTRENRELMCIQHDRAIESLKQASGRANGLVLLKSCIVVVRALPPQNTSEWHLIPQADKATNVEYAPQNQGRKTQPE